MPRTYEKKDGAYRAPITVLLSESVLGRLRRFARDRARPPSSVARELIEQGLPVETKAAAE
jgi:predicted transcriptional regulator